MAKKQKKDKSKKKKSIREGSSAKIKQENKKKAELKAKKRAEMKAELLAELKAELRADDAPPKKKDKSKKKKSIREGSSAKNKQENKKKAEQKAKKRAKTKAELLTELKAELKADDTPQKKKDKANPPKKEDKKEKQTKGKKENKKTRKEGSKKEPKQEVQATAKTDVDKEQINHLDISKAKSHAPDLLLGISHLYRLSMADLQAALKDESISASQWEILSVLSANTPLTQQDLAKALFVSEGNITQMLSKMETLGWIERKREWRTNFVTLSPAGLSLQSKVKSIYDQANERFFADLSEDEQEMMALLVERISANNAAKN